MSLYDRQYMKRVIRGDFLTPAIKQLLVINISIFVAQTFVLLLRPEIVQSLIWGWFGLIPSAVIPGLRLWQPFTYLFLHGGFWHLFWNMITLWMFGQDLERQWGTRRFYRYYFMTGAGAGLINILVKIAMGGRGVDQATIGASGAIYGLVMAMALLFPDRQVMWILPPIVMPMRVFAFIMAAIAFFGTLGQSGDNVSHITHLSGMLVGYLYLRRGSFLYSFRNRFLDWKRQRARRKFEVYQKQHRNEPPSRPDQWVN